MAARPDDEAALAARIAASHGGAADAVVPLAGVVNRVFRVTGAGNDWVVRYPLDPRRPNEFPVEIWAARQASLQGIPTPRVVATGHLGGRPYLVLEHVETSGAHDEHRSWRWLGAYAAVLAQVPLHEAPAAIFSRFGRDLPVAWRAHLDYNLDALSPADPLVEDGVYERRDLDRLRALLEGLRSNDFTFGLAHGDLAPRNLVPRRAPLSPVLLDWGSATSGPAPWTDLQRVNAWAVHDRTISGSALADFADAAGVPLDHPAAVILEQMSALRLLDLARWAKERRPDLYAQYRRSSQRGLEAVLAGT